MKNLTRLFAAIVLVVLVSPTLRADLNVPKIFSDSMVLQRDQSIPVWGWEDAGTEVHVLFEGEVKKTTAGDDGKWMVRLSPQKAGGPYKMVIEGQNRVEFNDVLVGEVWLCSGQSNMEWTVSKSNNPKEEIAAANHPRIRHIKFAHRPSAAPLTDVPSSGWQVCSPKTVAGFTGVGYFFGRELLGELDVPVGLIGCNWGGTRIEPWTPPVGFKETPGLSAIADKLDEFPTKNNQGKVNHQSPLALYNGMVHSIVPYGMRGTIWYQGESNNGEGMLYHEKMKALIHGWRKVWDNDSMPFGFVQLAPYTYGGDPTRLAGIWEAQPATLKVPHTGMAVTVDVANLKDIHPRNKQDVGRRLALWALSESYGQKEIVYSGPIYKSMKVEGGRIRISFDHVGSGLVSRDDKPLNWFTIAGDDGKFVEATATIDGQDVVVTAESVAKPTAVRFGWSQLAEPNLSNKEGLPASPFRTDSN